MNIYRVFVDTFWSENVWLPPNTTWNDIKPGPDKSVHYTNHLDLIYPLPMALVVLVIRFILDRFWFAPVGRSIGIRNTRSKRAASIPELEAAYTESSKLKYKRVVQLCKQTDLTERQVERWWRLRRNQDKPSTLVKFCETAWRCFYYTCIFLYGIIILWDKPWLWDIDQCYVGYPHQGVTNDIWWYYMISLSFYWSLSISQFFDVKRKDFWQMFIHHIATIALMAFSWVCNLHRIGSLVLVLHDFVDIFLEAAKMTKYANYQKLCDCIFAVFTVMWVITRVGVFPLYIIWSTSVRAPTIIPMFPAYYVFNGLLCILLCLHLFWTWLIIKLAYKTLSAGQMEGDIRSSSSDEVSDSSGTSAITQKASTNNHTVGNNHNSNSLATAVDGKGGKGGKRKDANSTNNTAASHNNVEQNHASGDHA